ncbi:MAG: cvrA [Thermoleophilia bacterium]|nr:cvrA [Thermoleophilia bacterium]
MESVEHLTVPLLLGAAFAFAAIVASGLGRRFSLPTPAIFLALGLAANAAYNGTDRAVEPEVVAQVGTVALVLILFEGGFTGGMRRMRGSLGPVLALGIVGTLATTGLLAFAAHVFAGLAWQTSVLVAVALAPTDPAAVFSILGSRDVRGRSSAIIEGESGANDPVGIALMVGALAYYDGDASIAGTALTFTLELLVGAAVGLLLGWLLSRALAPARLRSQSLLPLAAIAGAFLTYTSAVLLHGSGFLAVLVAGLVMGDALRRHTAISELVGLGSAMAEIVMFTLLGLLVDLDGLGAALGVGLAMFAVLTFVVRPIVVALLLAPARLEQAERIFVAWGGLKGAVPVLLATFVLLDDVASADRVFAIVFVAVAASILVQGGSIPWLIGRLGLVDEDADAPAPSSAPAPPSPN